MLDVDAGELVEPEWLLIEDERIPAVSPTTVLGDADVSKAAERGAHIACGTDAPAVPRGGKAEQLVAPVDRGMTPLQAIRATTTVLAGLIDVTDRGRLQPGLCADVIAIPVKPRTDIAVPKQVGSVVMGGQVYRREDASA